MKLLLSCHLSNIYCIGFNDSMAGEPWLELDLTHLCILADLVKHAFGDRVREVSQENGGGAGGRGMRTQKPTVYMPKEAYCAKSEHSDK